MRTVDYIQEAPQNQSFDLGPNNATFNTYDGSLSVYDIDESIYECGYYIPDFISETRPDTHIYLKLIYESERSDNPLRNLYWTYRHVIEDFIPGAQVEEKWFWVNQIQNSHPKVQTELAKDFPWVFECRYWVGSLGGFRPNVDTTVDVKYPLHPYNTFSLVKLSDDNDLAELISKGSEESNINYHFNDLRLLDGKYQSAYSNVRSLVLDELKDFEFVDILPVSIAGIFHSCDWLQKMFYEITFEGVLLRVDALLNPFTFDMRNFSHFENLMVLKEGWEPLLEGEESIREIKRRTKPEGIIRQ